MSSKPNIVFMIADDHQFNAIRAFADQFVQTPDFLQTPNLDRLAEGGTSFMNTHIMGGWHKAVCTPSRACVLTGGNVFNAVSHEPEPVFDDFMKSHCEINPAMELMPEAFRKAGYHTYAIGKWHNDKKAFKRGFSGGDNIFFGGMFKPYEIPLHHFNPDGEYPLEEAVVTSDHATKRFCDAGVDFIEEYNEESPFFMYMAFTAPHDPRRAPTEYMNLYEPANIPLPKNFMNIHPFDTGQMQIRASALARLPREPLEICRHIADYYSMITHMDAQLGRVLNALQKKGIADNTILVYTSDHGLALGQHGLMAKQNMYDHSIRIPFLIKGPGLQKGKQISSLTCQMDIFPTLCELAGIKIPETIDGKSLVSLINGRKQFIYESAFSAYKDLQRMIKKDGWKMVRYYRSEISHTGSERVQLFNVEEDPWEINNLAGRPQYLPLLRELSELMRQWQINVNDPLLTDDTNERAYLGGGESTFRSLTLKER